MVDIFDLLWSELVHFAVTSLVAGFLFWRWRDWRLVVVSFAVGMLIDLDHWFGCFVYWGFNIDLIKFLDVGSYVGPSGKVYILLHGWEFIIPFWLMGRWAGKKFKINGLEWAIALAYSGHLLWDHFSFSHHPLAYSFLYRLLNNFSLKAFNGR